MTSRLAQAQGGCLSQQETEVSTYSRDSETDRKMLRVSPRGSEQQWKLRGRKGKLRSTATEQELPLEEVPLHAASPARLSGARAENS